MPMIKINGLTYEFNDLSDEVKGHLKYMAFVDAELEQLAMRKNVLLIARDQIGQNMDRALLRDSINQSPTDQALPPAQPEAPQA